MVKTRTNRLRPATGVFSQHMTLQFIVDDRVVWQLHNKIASRGSNFAALPVLWTLMSLGER
eukprot:1821874-Amphidinium_carterae.1